ncbi:MAG: hypothetical protein CMK59_11515 [Proteobacteria bacterium]|nr:hypothetical protein [Pseudomonadota bacterium]
MSLSLNKEQMNIEQMNIEQMLHKKSLFICVGAGGVGKTSTAAALALQFALKGKKALVLTIDPAKRLANALGLSAFGNKETQISLDDILQMDSRDSDGELWAMMLDGKQTFDDLIEKLSKDEKSKQAILNNRVYKSITETIVGNQEYMATEKLYDVVCSDRYDVVVLDTPPVKNALDFLDSPGRMARFVDKKIMRWFLAPTENKEKKLLGRLLEGTSSALFYLLGFIFGKEFLEDIAVFFNHFRDLYEGFHLRHSTVEKMFGADSTAFFIVTAPNEASVDVAEFFVSELEKREMDVSGVIVNQRHFVKKDVSKEVLDAELLKLCEQEGMEPSHAKKLYSRLTVAYERLLALSEQEEMLEKRLSQNVHSGKIWSVPRLSGEVHDTVALKVLGEKLLNASAQ